MIKLILADDHKILRQGLRALLESEPDVEVVGEACEGYEAARLVKELQPDILVVDLRMPGLNGIEVTRSARECSPRTGVIILSMYGNEAYVLQALRAGAGAYVLKDSSVDDLVQAIREVLRGGSYISPALSKTMEGKWKAEQAGAMEFDLNEMDEPFDIQ